MGKKYNFDFIIIGSGPAGTTTALTLAKAKKRVALVEATGFGGNNLRHRDIPYAVCLDFAHTFAKFSHYPEVREHTLHYNFPTINNHQNSVIASFSATQKTFLENSNLTCLEGHAHFIDAHTVAVDKQQYTARNFILATGSTLKATGISGLEQANYFTPSTALRISRLPKYALVVGGGPAGCEIASYYASLGTKVVLMEQADRLLPQEDKEASVCLTEYFTRKLGILVITGATVVALERDHTSQKVIYSIDKQEKSLRIDHIVLATGAKPYTDYGLENAGVKRKRDGSIAVSKLFQTTAKNIYAIGDCLGGESSTERAEYQASILAAYLTKKIKTLPNYQGFARLIKTYPEVATVGPTEKNLRKLKRKYKKSIIYFKDLPMSKIERFPYGFVKIFTDHKNHLLGATIVGPQANLMIGELSVAIRHRLNILELASTPHIANSYALAIKLAARQLIK